MGKGIPFIIGERGLPGVCCNFQEENQPFRRRFQPRFFLEAIVIVEETIIQGGGSF